MLNAFAAANKDVAVLGVSVDKAGPDVVPSYVARTPIDYPVLFGSEALAERYGAPGFPSLAVIARDGRLLTLHVGLVSEQGLLSDLMAGLR